jgi:hypothetical protein
LKSPKLFQSKKSNPTKGIMFNKGGNTIFGQMKVFQIRENIPQQILILPTMVIKRLQKNGTIQAIEHVFIWHIVYEQCVANVNIRINKINKSKFLWKIGLSSLSNKKYKFCMQNSWSNILEACIEIFVLCHM